MPSGTVRDLQRQALDHNGFTGGSIDDDTHRLLDAYTGGAYTGATTNDLWGVFCDAYGVPSENSTLTERLRIARMAYLVAEGEPEPAATSTADEVEILFWIYLTTN